MKLNTVKCGFLGLFTLLTFGGVDTAYGATGSTPVRVVATIVDGTSELVEKIGENLYQGVVENNYDWDIVFTSDSDIKSFPKQIVVKPGEKQTFKFITKNKENIKLSYELMGKTIPVKTYNDLYAKN
ncbi:hypothetical protein [Cetobacterium sp. SF1]|uniref:hypothetical protein n=1 Tax=Cetobacterium sp. SF1 TaxID=3417654 RepID=UPI003CF66D17